MSDTSRADVARELTAQRAVFRESGSLAMDATRTRPHASNNGEHRQSIYWSCVTELSLMIDHVSLSVYDLERSKLLRTGSRAAGYAEIVGEVTAEQSGSVLCCLVSSGSNRAQGLPSVGAQRPSDARSPSSSEPQPEPQ